MSLPNTYTPITSDDIYPDHVEACFQYQCLTSRSSFNAALRQLPHVLVGGGKKVVLIVTGPAGQQINMTASRANHSAPISIYVGFNALSQLHSVRSDFGDEVNRAPGNNWLHPDDVSYRNDLVYNTVEQMWSQHELVAHGVAQRIVSILHPGHVTGLVQSSISKLELVVDLEAPNPGLVVERLSGGLLRLATEVTDQMYFSLASPGEGTQRRRFFRQVIGIAHMAWCFRRPGERWKIYDKTNKRVRLEVQLKRRAARALGVICTIDRRTSLGPQEALPVSLALRSAAEAVVGTFCDLQRHGPQPPICRLPSATPLEFVTAISSIREPSVRADAIRDLITFGRLLTKDYSRPVLNRLVAVGLLERSGRGVCAIADFYQEALTFLGGSNANSLLSVLGSGD